MNSKLSSEAEVSDTVEQTLVKSRDQLVEYLESGCKNEKQYRIGAEQEQFVFSGPELLPAEYDGVRPGINALLENLIQFGWEPVEENHLPIALKRNGSMVTLEPGGQVELSGAPHSNIHQIAAETNEWHAELKEVSSELQLHFLAIGAQPKFLRSTLPWMPKQRYRIMREWMPKQGTMGLDMMQATCSQQITLDFSNEADMVKKFRVSLALQPIAIALFANSPFFEGTLNGCLSNRSRIWSHTDPQRSGALPFVFESGMGFERYVDYVLNVPMYFVERDGQLINATDNTFRDFLSGNLNALPGEKPTIADWESHLTTVFPQVRLKKFLEMRGADAGFARSRVPALAALWVGLLYDENALEQAWEKVRTWSAEEQAEMLASVSCQGFKTEFQGKPLLGLAKWMVELADEGLNRRSVNAAIDAVSSTDEGNLGVGNKYDEHLLLGAAPQIESSYLAPLREIVESGQTFAEQLVQRFEGEWDSNLDLAIRRMCEETLD